MIIARRRGALCLLCQLGTGILLFSLAIFGSLLRSITVRYVICINKPFCGAFLLKIYIYLASYKYKISCLNFNGTQWVVFSHKLHFCCWWCRMVILDSCYLAMMLNLAMIHKLIPFKPGNWHDCRCSYSLSIHILTLVM